MIAKIANIKIEAFLSHCKKHFRWKVFCLKNHYFLTFLLFILFQKVSKFWNTSKKWKVEIVTKNIGAQQANCFFEQTSTLVLVGSCLREAVRAHQPNIAHQLLVKVNARVMGKVNVRVRGNQGSVHHQATGVLVQVSLTQKKDTWLSARDPHFTQRYSLRFVWDDNENAELCCQSQTLLQKTCFLYTAFCLKLSVSECEMCHVHCSDCGCVYVCDIFTQYRNYKRESLFPWEQNLSVELAAMMYSLKHCPIVFYPAAVANWCAQRNWSNL